MKKEQLTQLKGQFDEIVQKTPDEKIEFWYARDLMPMLEYDRWENFKTPIAKALASCEASGYKADDHFRGITKMVPIGSGAERPIENHFVDFHEMVPIGSSAERSMESVKLSRYACYLIVQNASPSKTIVALGQTYFAIKIKVALEYKTFRRHQNSLPAPVENDFNEFVKTLPESR